MTYSVMPASGSELFHYGTKGMKWGVKNGPPYPVSSGTGKTTRSSVNGSKGSSGKKNKKKTSLLTVLGKKISGKKEKSSDPKEEKQTKVSKKKKSLSELSDDEIRQKIARLELEKRYKELSNDVSTNKRAQRGKQFCIDVLESIGKNTLTNLGTQAANHVLGNAINKAAGVKSDDVLRRVVNPQKGQTDKK